MRHAVDVSSLLRPYFSSSFVPLSCRSIFEFYVYSEPALALDRSILRGSCTVVTMTFISILHIILFDEGICLYTRHQSLIATENDRTTVSEISNDDLCTADHTVSGNGAQKLGPCF